MKEAKKADRVFAIGFLSGLVLLYLILKLCGALYLSSEETGSLRYIHVPKGASAHEIANKLAAAGILRNRLLFLIAAKTMRAEKELKFGDYELHTGMAPVAIIRELTAGHVTRRRLTVPEGFTVEQIGRLLERRGLANKEAFLAQTRRVELLSVPGLDNDALEGFLFPDTYYVAGEENPENLLRMMVNRFEEVYRRESLGSTLSDDYDVFDIVRIASIVEKEAFLDSEKPLIAGVIYNRLRKNMRLDCDVTIQYGLNKFGRRLTYADLAHDSPYNSYIYKGLPPGPICNPGRASLHAALHPAETDYLYFVSKNNGTHHFSKTLSEHNRAVRKYQLGL